MNIRTLLRVGLPSASALATLLLPAAPAVGAQTNGRALELPRGRTYELLPSTAPVATAIPLRLRANVKLKNLRAVVVATTLDSHADKALDRSFEFAFRRGPHRAPLLTLTAIAPRALEQGTYTLLLSIFSMRGRSVAQRIPLTIVVPAAVLRQPQPQAVTSTVWFPWDDAKATRTLTLRETGESSWVADVVSTRGDTGRATDQLVAPARLDSIPRGGVRTLKVTFRGDYPFGDTRGSFDLAAAQLASPVTVEYTLTKRLEPLWIVILALVGAGLGTFTRVTVKRYSARRKAREQAVALLAELRRRTASTQDPVLHDAFEQQSAKLARSLAVEQDGETLLRAVAQVEADLRLAIESHLTRSEQARAQLSEARKLVGIDWQVPAPIAARLADARRRVETAAQALDDDQDATTAKRRLDEVADLVAPHDLRDAVAAWREETRDFARWTETLRVPSDVDAGELRARHDVLLAALDDDVVWAAPDSTARAILNGLQRTARLRQELAKQATDDVKAAIDAAESKVSPGDDGTTGQLAARVEAIDAAWAASSLDASPDNLKQALAYGLAAVRRAAERRTNGSLAPADATPQPQAPGPAVAAATAATDDVSATPAREHAHRVVHAAGADETRRSKARAAFVTAKDAVVGALMWSARTCSTMILVAIAALVLFRGTWVGTFDQIIAVFLWGYGLNLSATTLIEIATRPSTSTTAPGAA